MDTTQRKMTFSSPAANGYYDLALNASAINHRLYRQGRCYYAKFDLELDAATSGQRIEIQTLPTTWFMKQAWNLAYRKWMDSHEDERELGTKMARWNDFRVHLDSTHVGATSTLRLADGVDTPDEYLYTIGETVGGLSPYFSVLGTTSAASYWGILNEYDTLADTMDDVTPAPAGIPYEQLNEELDDDQANEIQNNGDAPPYNSDGSFADAGVTVKHYLFSGQGSNRLSTGYIPVPFGLFKITAVTDSPVLSVTLKNGDYKGIDAHDIRM